MAWLARSIANSLKLDEEEDDGKERIKANLDEDSGSNEKFSPSVLQSQSQSPRGVKEDISELTKTLRSQLWGVASFLAPPPSSDHQEENQTSDHVEESRRSSDLVEDNEDLISGIKNDFVEIGGRFRTGISKISGNIQVSEITKIASNFLQLGSEGDDSKKHDVVGDVIGVTEEVVGFARDLALHPETWLDFPFPDEDDNFDDFEMTDAQQDHALAVERLASSLAALRIELCPAYMTESCFWRIYFVLVHPKFSKHDALLLSTPQVLEARALLSHELQKRNKSTTMVAESNPLPSPEPDKTISVEATDSNKSSDIETEKHPVETETKEIQVIDKSVIEERPARQDKNNPVITGLSSSRVIDLQVDDDDEYDEWLKDDETSESVNSTVAINTLVEDEDLTFSDLEDDEDDKDRQRK